MFRVGIDLPYRSQWRRIRSEAPSVQALLRRFRSQAATIAIRATRKWGRIALLGEGGEIAFYPSADMIHDQKTLYGSWVTSTWKTEELVERLVRWNLQPESLVAHRFALEDVGDAYALMAAGKCGKVAICFDEVLHADRPA